MESLREFCAVRISSNISVDNAAMVLLLAEMHNSAKLKAKCIEFISANSKQVIETDGWKQMLKANRIELLNELYLHLAKK